MHAKGEEIITQATEDISTLMAIARTEQSMEINRRRCDADKVLQMGQREEEILAMTAREAFEATFRTTATAAATAQAADDDEDGTKSGKIAIKEPPKNKHRLPPRSFVRAEKCTALGSGITGTKTNNERAKVYVQMRDRDGRAIEKMSAFEREWMRECGLERVELRVVRAQAQSKDSESEDDCVVKFDLDLVEEGKDMVYYGEYQVNERGSYNVFVDVVFSEQRNEKNNGRMKIEGSPFPVFFEDYGGTTRTTMISKNDLAAAAAANDDDISLHKREFANNNINNKNNSNSVYPPTSSASYYDVGNGMSVENNEDDKRTVHVANLSIAMDQEALVTLFSHVGTVVATKMGGEGKTYAFVEFLNSEQAEMAKGLHGMEIGGRNLKVDYAKSSRLIGTTTNVQIHYEPQQLLLAEQEELRKQEEQSRKQQEQLRKQEEREEKVKARDRARAEALLAAEKMKPFYSNPNYQRELEMQKVLEGKTEEEILLERDRAEQRQKALNGGKRVVGEGGEILTAAKRAAIRAQEISARLNAAAANNNKQ
jgi:RNA recognition motif-containing protein